METINLRDYFAAIALQGLIAATGQMNNRLLVFEAYKYADMMIQQREQING